MNKPSDRACLARSALGRVHLAEPDPAWARLFENERRRLTLISGGAFKNVAHFGSTAVPGLRAKPIIDIMVSVEVLSAVDALLPALRNLGYEPVDAGFLKRRFLRKRPAADGLGYHLHVVSDTVWPAKNELRVRDWLIAHPDVAACYETLKEALARNHPDDMAAYTAAKTEFLRKIVNDARQSSGLPPETDWTE
jgi:GrpB-like predicted nucleotidyltransferase (UPF0157 family)